MNDFYPPAAADWGINLSHLIVVRPALALADKTFRHPIEKETDACGASGKFSVGVGPELTLPGGGGRLVAPAID